LYFAYDDRKWNLQLVYVSGGHDSEGSKAKALSAVANAKEARMAANDAQQKVSAAIAQLHAAQRQAEATAQAAQDASKAHAIAAQNLQTAQVSYP